MPHQLTKNGWKVGPLLEDRNQLHALVFNPHLQDWFHVWWNLQGKCLTLGSYGKLDIKI